MMFLIRFPPRILIPTCCMGLNKCCGEKNLAIREGMRKERRVGKQSRGDNLQRF
jgi:hypothetical protein